PDRDATRRRDPAAGRDRRDGGRGPLGGRAACFHRTGSARAPRGRSQFHHQSRRHRRERSARPLGRGGERGGSRGLSAAQCRRFIGGRELMTLEATQSKPASRTKPGTRHSFLFTSESVTEGHPDKVADQISDAILKDDPSGRVAAETLVTTGLALVSGEITTKTYVDIPRVVRGTIRDIGYDDPHFGFDWENCAVLTAIDEQS